MSQEIRTTQLVRKQIQTKLLYNLKAIKNNILLFYGALKYVVFGADDCKLQKCLFIYCISG